MSWIAVMTFILLVLMLAVSVINNPIIKNMIMPKPTPVPIINPFEEIKPFFETVQIPGIMVWRFCDFQYGRCCYVDSNKDLPNSYLCFSIYQGKGIGK
jgi:hypothetical protein